MIKCLIKKIKTLIFPEENCPRENEILLKIVFSNIPIFPNISLIFTLNFKLYFSAQIKQLQRNTAAFWSEFFIFFYFFGFHFIFFHLIFLIHCLQLWIKVHIFAGDVKTQFLFLSMNTSDFPCISNMPTHDFLGWSAFTMRILCGKVLFSWVILKSITSCTGNRVSTNGHGKYVTNNKKMLHWKRRIQAWTLSKRK